MKRIRHNRPTDKTEKRFDFCPPHCWTLMHHCVSRWKGVWTDDKRTALEWLSAWQTLMPYWMTNKTSQPTIWQALQLSLTAPRLTSAASGWEQKKKPLMAYFNEPLSNICTAAWNGNTQDSTAHVTFQKLSTLLFLFCKCLEARDSNDSSVSLPGVCSSQISHIATKLRDKSLFCQNTVKYF